MSDEAKGDVEARVDELEGRLQTLESRAIEPSAADGRIIARMQSNTSWAIHYSTVRMTIGTFFITTCLTIMGLKWNEPEVPIVLAAAAIWVAGFLLFLNFTGHTARMRVAANKKRDLLLLKDEAETKRTAGQLVLRDGPRWTVIVLTVLFAIFLLVWSKPLWATEAEEVDPTAELDESESEEAGDDLAEPEDPNDAGRRP